MKNLNLTLEVIWKIIAILLITNIFLRTLELHAPFKKKVLRANHAEYMTKQLRKAIMRRSALENKFRKYRTEEHNKAYRKHMILTHMMADG